MTNLKELAAKYFTQLPFDLAWAKPEPQYVENYIPEIDIEFTRRMLTILGD